MIRIHIAVNKMELYTARINDFSCMQVCTTIDNRILILYYFKLLLKIESAFKIYIYNL